MYWARFGELLAAVTQDYMCEPFMLKITGLTVKDHQRLTVERYDALRHRVTSVYIMPVLQGYDPEEYADHVRQYGERLAFGAWVGVGSVCKRNGNPKQVLAVLRAILAVRPDLRLHGFGLKITALRDPEIRALLWTADSMAWSFAARREGRNANDWREAIDFQMKIKVLMNGEAMNFKEQAKASIEQLDAETVEATQKRVDAILGTQAGPTLIPQQEIQPQAPATRKTRSDKGVPKGPKVPKGLLEIRFTIEPDSGFALHRWMVMEGYVEAAAELTKQLGKHYDDERLAIERNLQ